MRDHSVSESFRWISVVSRRLLKTRPSITQLATTPDLKGERQLEEQPKHGFAWHTRSLGPTSPGGFKTLDCEKNRNSTYTAPFCRGLSTISSFVIN